MIPPAYVWVGSAIQTTNSRNTLRSIAATFRRQQQHGSTNSKDIEMRLHEPLADRTYSYYSRVALKQSAMEPGHPWHHFAALERIKAISNSHTRPTVDVSYHYMGSSLASRGRPSSRIIKDVYEEFCDDTQLKNTEIV